MGATFRSFPSGYGGSYSIPCYSPKCVIRRTNKVVFCGDSITAAPISWFLSFVSSLAQAGADSLTVTNSGVSGARIQDLSVAGQIAPYTPDVVVMCFIANDAFTGVNPTTFGTTYASRLDSILALTPVPQILVLTGFCLGEQWATGPVWATSTYNTAFNAMADQLVTVCGDRGVPLADTRNQLLLWESVNNAGPPGVDTGVFCSDPVLGVHLKYQYKPLVSSWVMPYVSIG